MKLHRELATAITKLFPNLQNEPAAHQQEHAIEVQLPFLQYALREHFRELSFVPIVINTMDEGKLRMLALGITEALMDMGIRPLLIASSNFTHYGPKYGYMPFHDNVDFRVREMDQEVIRPIMRLDAKGFRMALHHREPTIDGAAAISTLLQVCQLTKVQSGEFHQYYHSSAITNDRENFVGYGALTFS